MRQSVVTHIHSKGPKEGRRQRAPRKSKVVKARDEHAPGAMDISLPKRPSKKSQKAPSRMKERSPLRKRYDYDAQDLFRELVREDLRRRRHRRERARARIRWNGSLEQLQLLCQRLLENGFVSEKTYQGGLLPGFSCRKEGKGWKSVIPGGMRAPNRWRYHRKELAYLYTLLTSNYTELVVETSHGDFLSAFAYLNRDKKWSSFGPDALSRGKSESKNAMGTKPMISLRVIVTEVKRLGFSRRLT